MVAEKRSTSDVGLGQTITLAEAHALQRVATSERDRMLALVLWTTGCRISEATNLRGCDLLPEDQALRLVNRKQRDKRATKRVVVTAEALAELESYIRENQIGPADWLFPGREPGRHLTERQARNVIYNLSTRASVLLPSVRAGLTYGIIRRIHPHALRHSYATHLLTSGVDLVHVGDQLGHASISNTRKYLHLVTSDRKAALAGVRL